MNKNFLNSEIKYAMKSKDTVRLRTLRALKTSILCIIEFDTIFILSITGFG